MTVLEIANWIVRYRRNDAFKGYSLEKIVNELVSCNSYDGVLVISDTNHFIQGVICFRIDKDRHSLYVYDILTIATGVIKEMMKVFHTRFPGYILEGKRHNKKRVFKNTHKLERLLK